MLTLHSLLKVCERKSKIIGCCRSMAHRCWPSSTTVCGKTCSSMVAREQLDRELWRLELPFRGLFGRKLHGIDCQGLFCELDKYCREAVPELTSARSRIKAKYVAALGDMKLFFPPKWGLPSGGVVKTTGMQLKGSPLTGKRGTAAAIVSQLASNWL
jgi:alpha-glutamyl/putrescinyl thymine pyrophosphorylase clade 1